jgi:hypothetical protein
VILLSISGWDENFPLLVGFNVCIIRLIALRIESLEPCLVLLLHWMPGMLQTLLPSNAEVLQQLARIVQSQSLHGSEGLRSFLQFIVTKTLDKQESQLKEYTIAVEVFGRDATFDPRVDSVVRVQAGRLRTKVQEYYSGEGKKDPILIEIPKGHYSPSFSYLKPPQVIDLAQSKKPESVPAEPKVPPDQVTAGVVVAGMQAPLKRDRRIIVMLVLLCIALGSSTLFFYRRQKENQAWLLLPRSDPLGMRILGPIWQDFLQSPEPVLIAYSNTLFQGTAETGMKLLAPLDSAEPGDGVMQPLQPLTSTMRGKVITQHYTGVGEVMGAYLLGEYFGKLGRSVRVKRSLLLTWEDLKSENFIFLGSPAENLLLRDLPQEQQFVFRTVKTASGKLVYGIVNLHRKAGEESCYTAKQEGPSSSNMTEDYALISHLKGLNPKTRLLILAGIETYGTQAAVEYVIKPEYAADLISHLNISQNKNAISLPPYYQVLIRVKVNGGVPVQSTYVTHHVLD